MIDGVIGDDGDGGAGRGYQWGPRGGGGRAGGTKKAWLALLEILRAKFRGLESTNQCRNVGKNALSSDPVIPESLKSSDEH